MPAGRNHARDAKLAAVREATSPRLALLVRSDKSQIAAAAARVRSFCADSTLEPQALGEIELAVVEALTDAIENAYSFRSDEEVVLIATFTTSDLSLEISDCGAPISATVRCADAAPSSRVFDDGDVEADQERGLHLAIICTVMDDVSYESHEGRNTLRLLRRLP
jgi:serine/threonine-protein kinase RsbW